MITTPPAPWFRRRRTLVLGALVALLASPLVAIRFIDTDRVVRTALEQLEGSTGYHGSAGPASARLGWSGAVLIVEDLKLTAPDSSQSMAVGRLEVSLQLWPLLRKEVQVRSVMLDHPVFVLDRRVPRAASSGGSPTLAFLAVDAWRVVSGTYRQMDAERALEFQNIHAAGEMSWDAGQGSVGAVSASVGSGRVAAWSIPEFALDVAFRLAAAADSLWLTDGSVHCGELAGTFSGAYASTGERWEGALSGTLESTPFAGLLPWLPAVLHNRAAEFSVGGTVAIPEFALRTRADGTHVTALARCDDVSFRHPKATQGFSAGTAVVHVDDGLIALSDGSIALGPERIQFDGVVDPAQQHQRLNLRGRIDLAVLRASLPGDFTLPDAGSLDLDVNLFRAGAEAPDLTGSVTVADFTLAHPNLPIREAHGVVRFAGHRADLAFPTLTIKNTPATDLTARAEWTPRSILVDRFQATVASGRVVGGGGMERRGDAPGWSRSGWVRLEGGNLATLTRAHWAAGHIEGALDAALSFAQDAEGTMTLAADLDLAVQDGAFVNLPVAASTAEKLGLPLSIQQRWPFRGISGHVRIRDGRALVDSLRISQHGLLWQVGGSMALDGTLDLAGGMIASPGAVRLPAAIEVLAQAVADDGGRIPVDFVLQGPPTNPTLRFDWDEFSHRVAEKAKERQGDRLEEILESTVTDPDLLQRLRDVLKKKP